MPWPARVPAFESVAEVAVGDLADVRDIAAVAVKVPIGEV